jgi:hypothetical protein
MYRKLSRYIDGDGLDGRGTGVRFPAGPRDFSLLHSIQIRTGSHLPYSPAGSVADPPGEQRQGHEADHSPPSGDEVKIDEAIISLLLTSS